MKTELYFKYKIEDINGIPIYNLLKKDEKLEEISKNIVTENPNNRGTFLQNFGNNMKDIGILFIILFFPVLFLPLFFITPFEYIVVGFFFWVFLLQFQIRLLKSKWKDE
jgi:hypothetical protein